MPIVRRIVLLMAALGLAGCHGLPPSAGTVSSLPLPPPRSPPAIPIQANWSFVSGAAACAAVASGGASGFAINVRSGRPVVFTMSAARLPLAAGRPAVFRVSGLAVSLTLNGEFFGVTVILVIVR